jgi:hypothetical protein
LETVAAIDRFITAWIERNFGDATALAASCGEHLARTAGAAFAASRAARTHRFASLTAIRTTIRFVLEAFLLVKALFARTENELTSTVHTVEHFIYVHEKRTP